jgi:drug/metabolite transporter (DMT)-like permease
MAHAVRAIEDRPQLGIVLMLVAWFLFALVDTSAKWLGALSFPAIQIAFMRYAGHGVIATTIMLRGGIDRDILGSGHLWAIVSRALLLISATVSNFVALKYLPLTVTAAIMFSSPILVCLLSFTMLGERIGVWRLSAILMGFLGVLIVIRPGGEAFHPAMLLPIYNATALALYSIQTRRLAGTISTEVMQFYMGAVGTLVLLPFAILFWQMPDSAFVWAILISTGVFGWAGHQLLTNAHRFGTANTLMPYTYSFMIYVAIIGFVLFGNLPDLWTVAGSLVIIGSGLIIWKREQR